MKSLILAIAALGQLNYPIVYLRTPRSTTEKQVFPEVSPTFQIEPNTDLILRQIDGTEEVLVAGGANGAVLDPFVTFDGSSILYSYCENVADTSRGMPKSGVSIYRIELATKNITRLTQSDDWDISRPEEIPARKLSIRYFGVCDTGPAPVPDGADPTKYRIVFSSTRAGYMANGFDRVACPQLYIMDSDGKNVQRIGHLNLAGALHPFTLKDGRLAFSSAEVQGFRDGKLWCLWQIWQDGSNFGPLFSAYADTRAAHFATQRTNGEIVFALYYHQNNNGAGGLRAFPVDFGNNPQFGFPNGGLNPEVLDGPIVNNSTGTWRYGNSKYPFQPYGLYSPTPWTHTHEGSRQNPFNVDHPLPDGVMGKVSHPSSAPGNQCLFTWFQGDDSNPANFQAVLAMFPDGPVITWPWELPFVLADPAYHFWYPQAVVSYQNKYGIPCPPVLTNKIPEFHADKLPSGTPYSVVGTSSFYDRETDTVTNGLTKRTQGFSTIVPWTNAAISKVALISMQPTDQDMNYSTSRDSKFTAQGFERLKLLGTVELRKPGGILDSNGNPDTSFAALIPGNLPYTFALLDENDEVLTFAQTWHQGIPGEERTDCRGCHAHHSLGPVFAGTQASLANYVVPTLNTVESYSWESDIKPIFQNNHCFECHSGPNPEAGFLIDDTLPKNENYVLAYDPKGSKLVDRLRGRNGLIQMPLNNPALSAEELYKVSMWINLGRAQGPDAKADTRRPTLNLATPARHTAAFDKILFGALDEDSGLNEGTIEVTADWNVNGNAPGTNLIGLFSKLDSNRWNLQLNSVKDSNGELSIVVRDNAGNATVERRAFAVDGGSPGPGPGPNPTTKQKVIQARDLLNEVILELPDE